MKTMNIKAKMIRKTVVAISTTLAVFFAGFAITTYAQENTNIETTMTIDGLVNNCEIITFSSSEPYSSRGYNFTITKEVDKNTPILINAMSEGKDNLSGTIDMSGYYRVRFIGGQIKEDHIDPRGEDEGPEENIVIHVKYIKWEPY
ncbi:MAG: hypothetical protein MJ133_07585 [Lachnospiraceae bacterium]|nr:hypothetical protein [Lachnospiraceae bacterium]